MDFIYKRAPLVEVIAEVHLPLIPLSAIPDAAVDPFFPKASTFFREEIAKLGYGSFERLVPDGVPLEMIPYQVASRYRKSPGKWPLMQLGPGIFTANMVPPYSGWDSFRQVLEVGHQAVSRSYQEAGLANPGPSLLVLRYMNAFTAEHGFTGSQAEFLERDLGLTVNLAREIPAKLKDGWNSRQGRMELLTDAESPPRSKFTLICGLGNSQGAPTCVVEFRVAGPPGDNITGWFNDARATIREVFEEIISNELRQRIGPKINLNAG